MLGGIVVSSIVSGVNGAKDVKKNCNEIQKLGEDVADISTFMYTEVYKRNLTAETIKDMNKQLKIKIGNIQTQIDDEEERQKQIYKYTQIINLVVVSSFIILIIAKVIYANVT